MDYAAALLAQTELFGDLVRDADPSVEVPTCPGWTLRQLFRHLGRGHRWAAEIVRDRLDQYLDPRTVPDGKPPPDRGGALRWLGDSAHAVLDAVSHTGEGTLVWTFLGRRPASWWIRRRLHEATVHRADAALALGLPYDLPADLAADGISEWLDRLAADRRDGRPVPLDPGITFSVRATDTNTAWLLTGQEHGMSWTHDGAEAAVAIQGSAVDLLLALTRRKADSEAGVEVTGAHTVWRDWLARTPL